MEMKKLFDLYSSLVSINGLLPERSEEIEVRIGKFENDLKNDENAHDDSKIICQYYKSVSFGIYSLVDKIRGAVEGLKCITSNGGQKYRGITNSSSNKINVMLLGETSAGKTTFLERMYGESCGGTSPIPITAFPVVHKITAEKSHLFVRFNNSFSVKVESEFKKFLARYFNVNDFSFVAGRCELRDSRNKEQRVDGKDSFIDCIYEANRFPTAFEEITWYHEKSDRKQIQFTHNAILYDMPGSGGQEEHTDNLEKAINRYGVDIDIVLYLLKPDQGVPSAYEFLKNLKAQFNRLTIAPDFCFLYQIPNNDDFQEKVKALTEFIKKDTEINGESFDKAERAYFLKANVVDARENHKTDKDLSKAKADIAMASVYRDYVLKKSKDFYESLSVNNEPQEFAILRKDDENNQSANSIGEPKIVNYRLFNFLEKVKKGEGNNLLISKIREMFKNEFHISGDIDIPKCDEDLRITLVNLKNRINNSLDSLLDFCSDKSWYIGKRKKRANDSQDTTIFDTTKYNRDFREQYGKKPEWQSLVYDIQTYHWLRLTYNGDSLINIYSRASANTVQEYLREYMNRLERLENKLSVMESLNQEY